MHRQRALGLWASVAGAGRGTWSMVMHTDAGIEIHPDQMAPHKGKSLTWSVVFLSRRSAAPGPAFCCPSLPHVLGSCSCEQPAQRRESQESKGGPLGGRGRKSKDRQRQRILPALTSCWIQPWLKLAQSNTFTFWEPAPSPFC